MKLYLSSTCLFIFISLCGGTLKVLNKCGQGCGGREIQIDQNLFHPLMVRGPIGSELDLKNRFGAFFLLLLLFPFLTYSSSLALSLNLTDQDLRSRHMGQILSLALGNFA